MLCRAVAREKIHLADGYVESCSVLREAAAPVSKLAAVVERDKLRTTVEKLSHLQRQISSTPASLPLPHPRKWPRGQVEKDL